MRSNVSLAKPARAQSPNSSPACAAPPIAASPGASQNFGIPLEGVEQQVSVFGGLINSAEGTLWTHVLMPRGWDHHRRGSSPGPESEPEAAIDLQKKPKNPQKPQFLFIPDLANRTPRFQRGQEKQGKAALRCFHACAWSETSNDRGRDTRARPLH